MIFIKRMLLSAGVWLFSTLLFIIPPVFAITGVLGNTGGIERALEQSKVYDEFVPLVLENAQKQNTDPQAQTLLAEPAVQSAIQAAFPPQTLRTSATSVISGVFDWLQGKTPEPQFTIDLTESKQALISNLNTYAEQRINSLPVCTLAQLQTINPSADILSLPCRPPGVDTAQLSKQFSDQLATNTPFLDKPVITNETLAKDSSKPITSDVAELPEAYQATQIGRWLLVGLAVALAALLILLRRNKKAGVRLVAWSLISAAALWGIACVVYWTFIDKTITGQLGADSTQAMVARGVQSLLSDVGKGILPWILLYGAVGVGALLAMRFWPRTPVTTEHKTPEASAAPTDHTPESTDTKTLSTDNQKAATTPKPQI